MTTRRFLRAATLAAVFALAAVAAAPVLALPTVQQVEAEVANGRYAQAETMMAEVVAAKPGSARAHYIYAEILAHNELLAKAAEQARLARTLEPSLAFAGSPEKFRSFERALEGPQGGTRSQTAPIAERTAPAVAAEPVLPRVASVEPVASSSGIPSWLWGAGFAVVAVMLWRSTSRRATSSAAGPGATGTGATASSPYGNPNYGPGVTPPGMTPGGNVPGAFGAAARGGGLLGAGLAGAGGFAAGMMVDQLLHRRNDGGTAGNSVGNGTDHLAGLGPDASTRFDGDAGADLADRSVDFGAGSDDWGSDPGSSSDGGGGDGGWDS